MNTDQSSKIAIDTNRPYIDYDCRANALRIARMTLDHLDAVVLTPAQTAVEALKKREEAESYAAFVNSIRAKF